MSMFKHIIADLEHVTSIEWILQNPVPADNFIEFSDNIHISLYHYSYPVIKMFLSNDSWVNVSMHESYSYVSKSGHDTTTVFLYNDITEEQLFQNSLVIDFSWLDIDLFRRCVSFGKEYMGVYGVLDD